MDNTTKQTARTPAAFLEKISSKLDEIWEIEKYCTGPQGRLISYPLYKLVGKTATDPEIGQIFISKTFDVMLEAESFDEQELDVEVAGLYYRPAEWMEKYNWDHTLPEPERYYQAARGEIIQTVLNLWLRNHPSQASYALLSERLTILLQGPGIHHRKPDLYRPTLTELVNLLLEDPSQESILICRLLVAGAMGVAKPGSVEEPEMRKLLPHLFVKLWKSDQFNYTDFRQAILAIPGLIGELCNLDVVKPEFYRDMPGELAVLLQGFCRLLASELIEKLVENDQHAAEMLKHFNGLSGSEWILSACAYLEEKNLKRLLPSNRWRNSTNPVSGVISLLNARRTASDEEEKEVTIQFFQQYSPATLVAILPYAVYFQDWICEALGWEGAYELVKIIESRATEAPLPVMRPEQQDAILNIYRYYYPHRRKYLDNLRVAFTLN